MERVFDKFSQKCDFGKNCKGISLEKMKIETKNLKKCDLDLNKWGGYIKGGIYDEYNGIPPCGTIVLEGNFSLPGCFCLWCSTIFSVSVINSSCVEVQIRVRTSRMLPPYIKRI